MKKQYILTFCLLFPVIFLAGWVIRTEYVLHAAQTVVIHMRGYDPRDLLSGHYLHLEPDWNRTDCMQFPEKKCPTERFARSYRYYLPEFDARELERQLTNSDLNVEMVFVYKGQAKPLVKDLLIEGKPWAEWLRQSAKQPVVR